MTLDEFKAYAQDYLEGEPYRSKNTYEQRKIGVEKFIRFMEAEGRQEVDTKAVLAYRRSLTGYAPNTFGQYMTRLKAFFNWMVEAGLTEKNLVTSKMVTVEKRNLMKKILREDEVPGIFSQERPTKAHKEPFFRYRAMTILFLTSGMRESELMNVTPNDLDWENCKIKVLYGKGDKQRTVLFYPTAQNAVRDYMSRWRPKEATDNDPIFLQAIAGKVKPLSRYTVYRGIKTYIERATGRDDLTPHSLRHSFASILVSNGMNLKELQTILGHSSLLTTEIYAKLLAPDEKPVESALNIFKNVLPGIPSAPVQPEPEKKNGKEKPTQEPKKEPQRRYRRQKYTAVAP